MKQQRELKSKSGEIVTIETITPEIAKLLLENNINNRTIKDRTVQRYARDMEKGSWKFNGDAIRIYSDGNLCDGQHRLMACLKANKAFETLVIRNIPVPVGITVDNGSSRSNADTLHFLGYSNGAVISSTAKKILSLEKGQKITFSPSEILEEISKDDRLTFYSEVTSFAEKIYKEYRIISKTNISAAYIKLRLLGYSIETIQDFFDQLSDQKEACGVIRSLRKRVNKVEGRSITQNEKYQLLVRCWNEYIKGNYDSVILRNTTKIVDFQ